MTGTFTEIQLSESGIATRTYRALLNSSRRYLNTISACECCIDPNGTHAMLGSVEVEGSIHDVSSTINTIVEQAQYYRDKEGRKRPANIYYVCTCSDIKLLYANIKYVDGIEAFLKSGTEPIYIDIGDHARIVEYSGTPEEYHRMCMRAGVLIYSSTGVVRQRLRLNWQNQSTWDFERIAALYPDEELYRACMRWLYRGGKVFSLADPNVVYSDVHALDITSAHIWHMLTDSYPTTPFQRCKPATAVQAIYHGLSVILDITFYDVSPRFGIGWENKTIELENPIFDGKNVKYADKMRVMLTEVDWMIYQLVYSWEACYVNAAWVSHGNPLPAYLRRTIKDTVKYKQELKHKGIGGEEYMQAKRDVNMLYGMMAQKLNMTTCGKDGTGQAQDYNAVIKHKMISPFWAVWTAAYTRYQQANMLFKLRISGANILYGDTDSVYCQCERGAIEDIVNTENARIKGMNAGAYSLKGELNDLGTWTVDEYSRFKSLGSKRYMYEDEQGAHYKCSGILSEAMSACKLDFPAFTERAVIPNARRVLVKNGYDPAYYRYESVSLSTCASDVELEHWYMRHILKL